MRKILLFTPIIFVLLLNSVFAQEIDDILKKIDIKLNNDKDYLNLYSLVINSENINYSDLMMLPRHNKKEFKLVKGKNVKYRFLLLLGGLGIDTLTIMRMDQIVLNIGKGKGAFANTVNKPDTFVVLNYSDLYYLSKNHLNKYRAIYKLVSDFIKTYGDKALNSILGIKPDKSKVTMLGISARDNEDYLNFMHSNSDNWYPYPIIKTAGTLSRALGKPSSFRVMLSLSKFTFSYGKLMDFKFGGGASVEVSAREKLLNMLPYESNSLKPAVRLLLELNSNKNLNKKFYMDLKFGSSVGLDFSKIFNSLPIVISETPKLNDRTKIFFDVTFAKPFNLPFTNIYFASATKNFSNPFVKFTSPKGGYYSYFNFTQFSYTMSFYWNTSDKKILRMGIDVGFGIHDVWKANYDNKMKIISTRELYNKINPIVQLSINFAPKKYPVFGLAVKHYASQIKTFGWFNLVEFNPRNLIRVSIEYITAPIGQNLEEWENKNGIFFEVAYRMGL